MRGTRSAQDTAVPLQVSVNPAYQALELEYALRKVGSVQLSQWADGVGRACTAGRHHSLSFLRL